MRSKYNYSKKKFNRKRHVVGVLLLALLIIAMINQKPEDIIYGFTMYCLPVLTYETEFGQTDKRYAASYEVPEWFYEDEGETADNESLAVMEQESTEESGNGERAEDASAMDNSDDKEVDAAAANVTIKNTSKGTNYTRKELSKPDFLLSKIFVVDSNTSMNEEELNIKNLMDRDMSLSDITVSGQGAGVNSSKEQLPYKVLIYHTHASESFADSRPGVKEDTVVGVGEYLTTLLNEQYGIPTYHDETTYDVIDGCLDRSKAYENSFNGISRILSENPSIEVVIDLHRDGVDEETHLVTDVNGKPTAKIMFLNGVSRSLLNGDIEYLNNPNKLDNLAFSFQLFLAGKENYGDFVRKIYVRSLRYNLHVMPRATLIEAGAQNNTLEEEMNAMEPLAAMLDKVLRNSK